MDYHVIRIDIYVDLTRVEKFENEKIMRLSWDECNNIFKYVPFLYTRTLKQREEQRMTQSFNKEYISPQ